MTCPVGRKAGLYYIPPAISPTPAGQAQGGVHYATTTHKRYPSSLGVSVLGLLAPVDLEV